MPASTVEDMALENNAKPMASMSQKISFDDYLSLSEITFEWGDSYDTKDWNRLRAILAPTLRVDYSEVNGHKWDSMPSEEFVGIMSHKGFVGDPLVHTQHHIGASKWVKISEDEVHGYHQLRAAHQRYTAADHKTVENKGHGHAMIQHWYKKVDGEWKFAGLRPSVRWNEFEFEKIFTGLPPIEAKETEVPAVATPAENSTLVEPKGKEASVAVTPIENGTVMASA